MTQAVGRLVIHTPSDTHTPAKPPLTAKLTGNEGSPSVPCPMTCLSAANPYERGLTATTQASQRLPVGGKNAPESNHIGISNTLITP